MHIVQIAAELAPIAKVGGLADVIYGLSKELTRLGHRVDILLPKYDTLHLEALKKLKVTSTHTLWSGQLESLRVTLIDPHPPHSFFNRGMIYGCKDDIERFAAFCKAAMDFLFREEKQPDVIHAHDWHTALIPILYKEIYANKKSLLKGVVFTIHNMEHQGKCLPLDLKSIGLKLENSLFLDKMQDPSNPGDLNLLKGGIVYADAVTTVSPTYEKEIQTPEGGFGLESTLIEYNKKLTGILNGIDEDFWNPEKDPYLFHKYPTHNIDKSTLSAVIAGKKENRRKLCARLNCKESQGPLVAVVSRLVPQKGPELMKHAMKRTLEAGGQFILLGSSPIPSLHQEFEALALKNNENATILLDKDEGLAHQIFAAADMLLIPSLFEPCGLTQMIALRYGTIPIARVTGGLADTVFDVDTSLRPEEERNGFTFEGSDAEGVDWALLRALKCFQQDQEKWHRLMLQGMGQDFSWKSAAAHYVQLYRSDLKKEPF